MQPIAAVVFVLDGILIGAGDVPLPRARDGRGVGGVLPRPRCWCSSRTRGLLALWGALFVFMFARWYGMGRRYRGDRGSSPAQCGRERSYGYLNP